MGPQMSQNPDHLEHISVLLASAKGAVLEIGPGTGDHMIRYKPAVDAGKIMHFVCAEPNEHLHPILLEKMLEIGLEKERIAILACGAEARSLLPALKDVGLIPASELSVPEKGVFDTIVSIKSLCSSPQHLLPDTVAVLQALLRLNADARFLFFEHCANETDRVTRAWMKCINPVWAFFVGGCRLDGQLDRVCKDMRGWRELDVRTVTGGWSGSGVEMFRWVRGECVKG